MHKTDLEARLRRHALHALLALDQKTVTREVEPRCTRERTQNLSAHKAIEQTKSKTGARFLTGTREIKRETSSGRRNPGARYFLIRATKTKTDGVQSTVAQTPMSRRGNRKPGSSTWARSKESKNQQRKQHCVRKTNQREK
jgi:hypothetical protein